MQRPDAGATFPGERKGSLLRRVMDRRAVIVTLTDLALLVAPALPPAKKRHRAQIGGAFLLPRSHCQREQWIRDTGRGSCQNRFD